jgi:hypothetical protein
MGKKLLLPVSWVLAPLVEQLYVFLLDVTSLESLFYHVLVVCKSNQLHVSISEGLLCNREQPYPIQFLISSILLTSCGVSSGHFKLEGKFLNMNQGEFYVYSTDGGMEGVDTIKVVGGRFTYEMPCHDDCTLMIVFPNFSEQPIFAESGESVELKGDASHLKEMEVKGGVDIPGAIYLFGTNHGVGAGSLESSLYAASRMVDGSEDKLAWVSGADAVVCIAGCLQR